MSTVGEAIAFEKRVREELLPKLFGQSFTKKRLNISWGGLFEFDAVSEDERIVACVCKSGLLTVGGTRRPTKTYKILADALYLLAAKCDKRVLVFGNPSLEQHFRDQQSNGRFPLCIQLINGAE